MALNPPLYQPGMPMSVTGEYFLLERTGISVEISVEGLPKLRASKGKVYLTTLRAVYCCEQPVSTKDGATFEAFDLPLKLMRGEKFNQPILGANNLSGVVDPIPGMGLPAPAKFKLTFSNGNASVFLHYFIRALSEVRSRTSKQGGDENKGLAHSIRTGKFEEEAQAFQDPSDPSVLFMSQPEIPVAEAYSVPGGRSNDSGNVATVVPVGENDNNNNAETKEKQKTMNGHE